MSVSEQVRERIGLIPPGEPFGYDSLGIVRTDNFFAVAKELERLKKKGTIRSEMKGIFYKPVKSDLFGELKSIPYDNMKKSILFKDGKRVGYVTGIRIQNELMLTTQIPATIKIATNRKDISEKICKKYRFKIVKPYVEITDENYILLCYLDVLKDFKWIPDLDTKCGIEILSNNFKEFDFEQLQQLIEYSMKYPPRVRAFLGALLENINTKVDLSMLKNSLNPFSKYNYLLEEEDLRTVKNWNIIWKPKRI